MHGCLSCKNQYEDFVRVMEDGITQSYRRVVLAMQVLAHSCEQCAERYLGLGYRVGAIRYCCPECALLSSPSHPVP